ncbi:agmatine deiminase family protein [Methylosoma difficile]
MTRFPAEWEKQSAVLIAWPHQSGDFSNRLAAVEQSYRFIALTISSHQHLIIVCKDDSHQQHIQAQLGDIATIAYVQAEMNDIWVRDTAFLTAEQNNAAILLNFTFNGWGGKYAHDHDNALNGKLLETPIFAGLNSQAVDFILEGGSVESDGIDTIMTTKQCLLNPNRNNSLTLFEIERELRQQFGATRIFWIDQPNLSGDDTDAHIDTLARFCTADTIAYTSCEDPQDPHYASLKNMEEQLQGLRTNTGERYQLVPLPMPKPIFDEEGCQLPANYANFLIINGAVMVPVYEDDNDAVALERLAACFPEHKIIATPCRPLVHQYGSLHCMTMQFPATVALTF